MGAAKLKAAAKETRRVDALQSKVAAIETANREAGALASTALEAATREAAHVEAVQTEVAARATAERERLILAAATRARQLPPIWLGIDGANPARRGPTEACRYTAKEALGSDTVWHFEGLDHCRVAVIMPAAGATDWAALLPGQKSTVMSIFSCLSRRVTGLPFSRDKAFDERSTVSRVGRDLFRFSNDNTRFNQEQEV